MKIIEVETTKHRSQFNQLPHRLYQHDQEWVSHLTKDIEAVFDPTENPYFKTGEAKRWLLLSNTNEPIGRVAAFFNTKYIEQTQQKIGGMGFFECIQDERAAFLLFDTCQNWLLSKGMIGMDGPINFGERDRFWGLMVKGYKHPSYLENYNPPFYQNWFEQYGFEQMFEQSTSEITVETFNYERFNRISQRVLQNPTYQFKHFVWGELEQFANDFLTIYNQAWAHRPDFVPMTIERVRHVLRSLKPILLENIIWFVYANGEPAGFYINVIEVNQLFKPLKGKMNWWSKLLFVWHRTFGKVDRVRGIVFGVVPKYQNLGLETGMIMNFHNAILKHPHIRASELAWIGDFNPKMHSLFEALGAKTTKVHRTYRKLF
ncbi:MAG: GNAT family N-acetyltransferase [Bacteroidia bacterium]|jgi:hypothetical protein|nr:GNAT family N-acetyltransferase [Bacteroidia bacterium]